MLDRTHLVASAALIGLALCLLAGCGSSTNANLPALRWAITDTATGKTRNFFGDAKTSVPEGHQISILLYATSPEKIEGVSIKGRGQWTCYGNGSSESHSAHEKESEIRHTPRQGKTTEFIRYGSDFSNWECGPGFDKPTGRFVFFGEGQNFAFEIAEAKLTICNSRGC